MKAFSVKIKFPMDHNTELAISTDNYSALWTEVWKPPVLSYLVFHFAHFMTTPFCYKLSTFTLISAMLTTKRALLHNELLSQKKHRQVCTLFVKKKKVMITESFFIPLLSSVTLTFLDLAVVNINPVNSESQKNEPKRIKICLSISP